ncbi:hypothetical protein A9Q02_22515 [Candidatus Chloroploca asiatica]|uniref:Uncharacterized protein n=1 Tax=Candidatus Chloroploca asiatica TaxID=1506545 RepID=A0A2H3KQB9_9CHLR|nr:hypothetical protein A9Q02_22515 [Candidatus Chloroploca asiatica]
MTPIVQSLTMKDDLVILEQSNETNVDYEAKVISCQRLSEKGVKCRLWGRIAYTWGMNTYQTYATDLTNRQWNGIKDLIPAAKPGGRPRSLDMRQVMNGSCTSS